MVKFGRLPYGKGGGGGADSIVKNILLFWTSIFFQWACIILTLGLECLCFISTAIRTALKIAGGARNMGKRRLY